MLRGSWVYDPWTQLRWDRHSRDTFIDKWGDWLDEALVIRQVLSTQPLELDRVDEDVFKLQLDMDD